MNLRISFVHAVSLMILGSVSGTSRAAGTYEVQAILSAGASVTVGSDWTANEVSRFITLGKSRVTIRAHGFPAYAVTQFLLAGARVIVDASLSTSQVAALVNAGGDRVSIVQDGFPAYKLIEWSRIGVQIIATGSKGPLQTYELTQILQQKNGRVTIDDQRTASEMNALVYQGNDRLTVVARGFGAREVNTLLSAGVRAVVDHSFTTFDVTGFCKLAKDHVTVIASGFATYELNAFSQLGAAIEYGETPASRAQPRAR